MQRGGLLSDGFQRFLGGRRQFGRRGGDLLGAGLCLARRAVRFQRAGRDIFRAAADHDHVIADLAQLPAHLPAFVDLGIRGFRGGRDAFGDRRHVALDLRDQRLDIACAFFGGFG